MKKIIYILFILVLASCNNKNNQNVKDSQLQSESLWHFDVTKEYPQKEIYIQDIADVEYLPLETNDSMLWLGREIDYFGDDYIIGANIRTGILIHDRKTGKALHSFHRMGSGPGEYQGLYTARYDKGNDEIYVLSYVEKKYYVYDSKGNYKRSFPMNSGRLRADSFFFLGNELIQYVQDNTYTRLSKTTGEVLGNFTFGTDPGYGLTFYKNDIRSNLPTGKFIKDKDGYILSAFASDTTYFLSPDMKLEPIGVRTPTSYSMEVPIFLLPLRNTSNYYFMFTVKKTDRYPQEMYMLDKKENRIYWLKDKIKTKDFVDHEIDLDMSGPISYADIPNNVAIQSLRAPRLCKAYEEGKLSGKLKEIASTLKEDDNPVLMIMKFKE